MFKAPVKSGGCSVVREKDLAAGIVTPAARLDDDDDVDDDDGCFVAAFCFVFNSEAMPSKTIHRNDGSFHSLRPLV
jgi:hypothetical protein